MRKHSFRKTGLCLTVTILAFTVVVQTANAELTLEEVMTWYWTDDTEIFSVAQGDVDTDGKAEVVTGGYCFDGTRYAAQLCVWTGATLALKNVKTTPNTFIRSVAIGDVDGDGVVEIVAGGRAHAEGSHYVAQLQVWNGPALRLEKVVTWNWSRLDASVNSVAIGDVDKDTKMEIITGSHDSDGTRQIAQLCVWNGATLALEGVQAWSWTPSTFIDSVAIGNVDGDAQTEIVTGGYYWDGMREIAQLAVWNGPNLAFENVRTWYWTSDTHVNSVAVGEVDGDGIAEIVTGGNYHDNKRDVAQACVWHGGSLMLENVKTWFWTSSTFIGSVGVGDVDGDAKQEIVTGGYCYADGLHVSAQLCVWKGATLALENVKTWYWTDSTFIDSVAVGDVDGNAHAEIVTGGCYSDGTRRVAQLCVWS